MIKSHKHTLPTVVPGLLLCVWCTQWSCWPSTTSKGFKFSAYLDEWGVVVVANSLKLLSTNTVNKLNAFGETHGKNTISTQSINSALHTPLGAQTLFRHSPLSWTMKRFVSFSLSHSQNATAAETETSVPFLISTLFSTDTKIYKIAQTKLNSSNSNIIYILTPSLSCSNPPLRALPLNRGRANHTRHPPTWDRKNGQNMAVR